MSRQHSSRRFRFVLLLFFLVVPVQLQGCKALTFLGGAVVTYTLEKVMDKVTNKVFGSASSPKPSAGTVQMDKSSGTFTIKRQVFTDQRTGIPIIIEDLTGTMKDGKFQYDPYSLNLIKSALGASFCPPNDKNCKVTNVSQK
jgi:hypothetical protein